MPATAANNAFFFENHFSFFSGAVAPPVFRGTVPRMKELSSSDISIWMRPSSSIGPVHNEYMFTFGTPELVTGFIEFFGIESEPRSAGFTGYNHYGHVSFPSAGQSAIPQFIRKNLDETLRASDVSGYWIKTIRPA